MQCSGAACRRRTSYHPGWVHAEGVSTHYSSVLPYSYSPEYVEGEFLELLRLCRVLRTWPVSCSSEKKFAWSKMCPSAYRPPHLWGYTAAKLRDEEGEIHLARRTLYLPLMIAATVTVACAVALSAVSEKAEATFPGKNGRIAYSGYDGNDYEIYTINSRGGAKRKVTNNNRDDYSPSYSPGAKRIAYVKVDGNDTEIYTIRVGGRSETKLTQNNADEFTPDYSPDGKKIVYAGLEGLERNNAESDIYKINAVGGGKTKLTQNNKYDTYPSYSPDGKKIVYTESKGKAGEDVYTINAFGGGKIKLTHDNADESAPSWGSRP
jgi:WD40-like Beta Propeller Repeat